jgi:hypothetical protein
MKRSHLATLSLTTTLGLAACGGGSDADPPAPFTVALNNCTEYVGVTTVPSAGVLPLVAPTFTAVETAGTSVPIANRSTIFKIRTSRCEQASIDGHAARHTTTVQVGVAAAVPAGYDVPGPGYSFQFAYITDNPELFEAMQRWGIAVEYDGSLSHAFTPIDAASGIYAASVHSARLGHFTVGGTVTPPTASSPQIVVPFLAEWSASAGSAVLSLRTDFPAIAIGSTPTAALPTVTVTATPGSLLASWLGANSAGFTVSSRFNSWASATMRADQKR